MTELERALVLLGRELDVPEAPDLAPSVRERLVARRIRRVAPPRRWALAVAIAALVALGAVLAVPDARSALFRVLHIGAERIELVGELPEVEAPGDLEAFLGERVTRAEARRRAGFDLRELEEEPDRIYLSGTRPTVWFLYGSPERVRLLVGQTPGLAVEAGLILKKVAGPETSVEEVSVNGSRGFFLSGEPHLVLLLDEGGNVVEETARLAGDVLVWEQDGVAFRLEGSFSKDEALDLAASLH